MLNTPELDKLESILPQVRRAAAFLLWLHDEYNGRHIREINPEEAAMKYFGINRDAVVAQERRRARHD